MASERFHVWHRWRDVDPTTFAFDVTNLWLREKSNTRAMLLRVRWNPTPGVLEPYEWEPPWPRELFRLKRGWWAVAREPEEPVNRIRMKPAEPGAPNG